MEFINLDQKMGEAGKEKRRMTRLFATEQFRSWMLYFNPGDGTDMHYHVSPETFLVLEGKASVKGINGDERILEKNEVVFFGPKDYYQITNVGSGPLVLFGNRSEGFGGPHVTAGEERS
jgi:mannose-6-phosphate isomerase-like protein (cupin superfamily)